MSSRIAVVLAALTCAVTLAACGDDEPTIASGEYIAQCQEEIGKQVEETGAPLDDDQVAKICQCTQDKLVEQGHGDKGIDDTSLEAEGTKIGGECAREVLSAE